jgi:large subunit ribosomal protein L25
MATVKLKVEKRKEVGKKSTKALRREDKVPAVVYSREVDAIPIAIDKGDLYTAMTSGARVLDLKIGRKKQPVIYRDIQHHPVTEEILHIDFLGIVEGQAVETRVGIELVGIPVGVKEGGGILEQILWDVGIRTLPMNIPEVLQIDVVDMEMGDSIQVGDLSFEDIEILEAEDRAVATVVAPTTLVVEEEEDEEELEGLELEEGEEAPEGEESAEGEEGEEEETE